MFQEIKARQISRKTKISYPHDTWEIKKHLESLKIGWKYNLEPSLSSRNQTLEYQHEILNLNDIIELRDSEILVWDSSITECCGKWSCSTSVTSQLYISILVGHHTLFPLKTSSHGLNSVILKWKTLRFKLCSSKVSCSPNFHQSEEV